MLQLVIGMPNGEQPPAHGYSTPLIPYKRRTLTLYFPHTRPSKHADHFQLNRPAFSQHLWAKSRTTANLLHFGTLSRSYVLVPPHSHVHHKDQLPIPQ